MERSYKERIEPYLNRLGSSEIVTKSIILLLIKEDRLVDHSKAINVKIRLFQTEEAAKSLVLSRISMGL